MAQGSPVGFLVPVNKDPAVDVWAARIPVLQGDNILGRNDFALSDKRVSRRHICFRASADGSGQLVVDGQNPIVLTSQSQRKKLCSGDKASIVHGDTIELIPGSFSFEYMKMNCQKNISSSKKDASSSVMGKRTNKEDQSSVKRICQISSSEALARTLQDGENHSIVEGSGDVQLRSGVACGSEDGREAIRNFKVSEDKLSLIFRLMRVQGLPTWANTSSVSIGDVIQGNVQVAILSNYMVDIDWLLSACPLLRKIPRVLVIHGESGATVDHLKRSKPANWILHKPPLPISYGTHHSKAMLLVYPQGVRVIVHTANLIYVDWNNKSQGLWMQDFPWKNGDFSNKCSFEDDLVDYLNVLKWPAFDVNLPSFGNVNINALFFRKFNYRDAKVRLIASVPGYHTNSNLKRWGHMKLRSVLEECIFDKEFHRSPLVYQFSSLGSLDEKWLSELASSMSSGFSDDKTPLGLGKPLIIWPTVEDVRCSLEGYAAGNAIPSPQKNVEKDFLKKYWARWKASHTGRCRAMPHIKTYTRYNDQKLVWFLLTSANLSKAAWGSLQKNNSQLMIRSYELGVLFLPSIHSQGSVFFSCTENGNLKQVVLHGSTRANGMQKTKLATLCSQGNKSSDTSCEVISLPVPYELPPQPYTAEDVPWSWDRRYTKKDVYGQVWPRHVQLYQSQDS